MAVEQKAPDNRGFLTKRETCYRQQVRPLTHKTAEVH
jgi:hypothetical protein